MEYEVGNKIKDKLNNEWLITHRWVWGEYFDLALRCVSSGKQGNLRVYK